MVLFTAEVITMGNEKLVSLRSNIPESYDKCLRQLPGTIGENVREAIYNLVVAKGMKLKPVVVKQGRSK